MKQKEQRLVRRRRNFNPNSSIRIFNEFVKYSEQGDFISEDIISKQCFQRWLRTRKKLLQHPEDSFRRVLLAHVRGSDRRKPFAEPVEASILNKLRLKDQTNRSVNPWSKVFDNPKKVGSLKHGGRSEISEGYGFHEKLRKAQSTTSSTDSSPSPSGNFTQQTANTRSKQVSLKCAPDNFFVKPEVAQDLELDLKTEKESVVTLRGVSKLSLACADRIDFGIQERLLQEQMKFAEDQFLDRMLRKLNYCPETSEYIISFSPLKTKRLYYPTLKYALTHLNKFDYRLSEDFILVRPEEQGFDLSKPILKYSIHTKTQELLAYDEETRLIIGNPRHVREKYQSDIELFNICLIIFKRMEEAGKVWFRSRSIGFDGKMRVLKAYAESMAGSSENVCYAQEESELTQDLKELALSTKPFLV